MSILNKIGMVFLAGFSIGYIYAHIGIGVELLHLGVFGTGIYISGAYLLFIIANKVLKYFFTDLG